MFVYSQDDESFSKCLSESSGTFTEISWSQYKGRHESKKKLIPAWCLVWNSESDLAHISTTGSQSGKKQGFFDGAEFSMK